MTSTQSSATVQQDALKNLITQGLPALKAGLEEAKKHIDDIIDSATNPKLKQVLEQGKQTSAQWEQRVRKAMEDAGANGERDNPIIEAHGEVAERIRNDAPTDGVRDLGIIASGQLALHYWIAAFGTMASYCASADMTDAAERLSQCVDDARQADEMHTDLAYEIMGRSRANQNGSSQSNGNRTK